MTGPGGKIFTVNDVRDLKAHALLALDDAEQQLSTAIEEHRGAILRLKAAAALAEGMTAQDDARGRLSAYGDVLNVDAITGVIERRRDAERLLRDAQQAVREFRTAR